LAGSNGADGKLAYRTTPNGARILDFAHAGYEGGGVALPGVIVVSGCLVPAIPGKTCAWLPVVETERTMHLFKKLTNAIDK